MVSTRSSPAVRLVTYLRRRRARSPRAYRRLANAAQVGTCRGLSRPDRGTAPLSSRREFRAGWHVTDRGSDSVLGRRPERSSVAPAALGRHRGSAPPASEASHGRPLRSRATRRVFAAVIVLMASGRLARLGADDKLRTAPLKQSSWLQDRSLSAPLSAFMAAECWLRHCPQVTASATDVREVRAGLDSWFTVPPCAY